VNPWQDLIPKQPVNLDFIHGLRDDKGAALLVALLHTALDELTSFRDQIALAIHHISDDSEGLVSHPRLRRADDKGRK
jgi:hypothetical protein